MGNWHPLTWRPGEHMGISKESRNPTHTHTHKHIHTMTKGIRNRSLVAWKVWQKLQEAAREERSKSFGVRQTLMIVRWRIKCKPKYNKGKGKVGGAGELGHWRALRQIQKPSSKVCSLRDLCTLWFIAKGRWERDRQSEEMEERGRERDSEWEWRPEKFWTSLVKLHTLSGPRRGRTWTFNLFQSKFQWKL